MRTYLAAVVLLLSLPAEAQTRLYFPTTTAAAITPAADAGWEDATAIVRRALAGTKGASAITAGQTVDITDASDELDRQYVSDALASGVAFTSGVTTVKLAIAMREFGATDDVDKCILGIRVLSNDGATVRATLLVVANYGPTLELINNATMRNKRCADGDTVSASYTTVANDRLVVELGYQNDGAGTTPQAAAKWGENATDCAEDETSTSDCAGWIEFSNAITFATSFLPRTLLLGVGESPCPCSCW